MRPVRFPSLRTRAIAIGGAAAVAGLLGLWLFNGRSQVILTHPLRIGFEENPPVQIRTPSGFSGLAVEIVNEAAKRARIELDWVETGTSSDEALRKGLVDLWPLMVDLPHRRKYAHFAPPYLHSNNVLLRLEGTPAPGRDFRHRIAVFRLPVMVRQLRDLFPDAEIVEKIINWRTISDRAWRLRRPQSAASYAKGRTARGEVSRLEMHSIANDNRLIEREPWLGAVPIHEFVDRVAITPLRIWARQTVENRGLGDFEVR